MDGMKMPAILAFMSLIAAGSAQGATISTNEIEMTGAPAWVTRSRVEQVVARVQKFMEWDIRRVPVQWYSAQAAFEAVHRLGPYPLAFSRRSDMSVHLGPRVSSATFDSTFGHELVHIVLYQKYKNSIPVWLDEGLANYVAKHGSVDYAWLSRQPAFDVRSLGHPFKGPSADGSVDVAKLHY